MSNKKGGRGGGGVGGVFDAKGQMSGADDGVCVCNLCLTAHVCVSILIYICLPVWHMCLSMRNLRVCVCVCEWQMRQWGGQCGQLHAALTISPPGAEDAPACHCRHGYSRKRGVHIGLLVCNREALPIAKLSLNISSQNTSCTEGTIAAIIWLQHLFSYDFDSSLANICPGIVESSQFTFTHVSVVFLNLHADEGNPEPRFPCWMHQSTVVEGVATSTFTVSIVPVLQPGSALSTGTAPRPQTLALTHTPSLKTRELKKRNRKLHRGIIFELFIQ